MTGTSTARWILIAGILAGMAGCADVSETPARSDELPDDLRGSGRLVTAFGSLEHPLEEVLGHVGDVVLESGGGMFILDDGRHEVLHVSSSGQLVAAMGREGRGPGELLDPVSLELLADRGVLVVVDRQRAVLQRLDVSDLSTEMERLRVPFMPDDACAVGGSLAMVGFADSAAIHLVDPQSGHLSNSIAASDLREMLRVPDPVRLTEAAEAASGLLACDAVGARILHAPRQLGWVRSYHLNGSLEWEARLRGFVGPVRVASDQGGVRFDIDPSAGYASSVRRLVLVPPNILALRVEHAFPRSSGRPARGETVFLSADTGVELGRAEGDDPIVAAVEGFIATLAEAPFPRIQLWEWRERASARE